MAKERGTDSQPPIGFDVASRVAAPDDEPAPSRGTGRLSPALGWARRVLPAVLGTVLVVSGVVAVTKIPEAEPAPITSAQRLAGAVQVPEPAQPTVEPVGPERRSVPKEDKKPKRNKRATKSKRHVTFSLGGSGRTTSGSAAPDGGSPTAPTTKPASKGDSKPAKKKEPKGPQATLLLRRLYKEVSGDHYHSVFNSEISSKTQNGYEMKEKIGYLFEEQIPGTTLLAIDEGVMGWLYKEDQGSKTRPLYRLKGPDYHEYEVIFTSSEAVKTQWEGDGWRLDRIEGYVVAP